MPSMRYVQVDAEGVVEGIVEVSREDAADAAELTETVMRELRQQQPAEVARRLHRVDARDRPMPGEHRWNPDTGRTVQLTATERQAYRDRLARRSQAAP